MAGSGNSFFQNLVSTMVGVSLGGFAVVLSSFLLFGITLAIFAAQSDGGLEAPKDASFNTLQGDEESINLLMQVPVSGPIYGRKDLEDSPFGGFDNKTYGYDVRSKLRKYAENKKIKGLLFVFKTPGGTIFGSRAIYDAINEYKEKTGNPVYAFIEGISASGGVMAMVSADKIFADHGSLIGSIGVIGGQFLYFDGLKSLNGGLLGMGYSTSEGITSYTISAGRSKDLGNPFRKPTEQELAELKSGVETEYAGFVELVSNARNIAKETLTETVGAMIMGNERAKTVGLIDGTMDFFQVTQALADAAELGEDWRLVSEGAPKTALQKLLTSFYQKPEIKCTAAVLHLPLAYHGNPAELCY